jgi:single-stranded-DNA-specific exonuclease
LSRKETAAAEPPGLELPAMGETASGLPWRLRPFDRREALAIEQKAGVAPQIARVLAARGVSSENAARYLNPSLRDEMPDPFVLRDMEKATARLAGAVVAGETIGVFGDYDVDGTTAASVLRLYLEKIGAPVIVYLPDRILEGYGPSIDAFRELAAKGAKIIVTVDCGAAAHKVIEEAAGEGLEIIVFDHHQMQGPPPEGAFAVVNPNRPDDISGLFNLSAAGVAFLGLVALNRALRTAGHFKDRPEPDLRACLDLVALGLVCDVMEMTGLTRVLVAQGLKVLGGAGNPGLAALGERAGVKGRPSAYHLGFLLGPRINAAGRIGHARLALELLTTGDAARRAALAERLHVMNAERQEIEAAVLAEALAAAEKELQREVIVVAGDGWHPGVIGIVAGRMKEALAKPVIVIGLDGDLGKGSGRSLGGVDLGAAIAAAKAEGLIAAGGGHAMAAGLTIARGAIADFTTFLNARLSASVAAARAARHLDIDAIIAASSVSKRFADIVEHSGPFGPGNPEPVFALTNMRADYVKSVGKDHLACTLVSDTGEKVRAIAFRAADTPLGELLRSRARLHVAGKIRADDWRGGEAAQMQISDAAKSL